MISKFFIDRPVFASVLSIVIVLAGLVAMRVLPISQYPQIVPPEVIVSATIPAPPPRPSPPRSPPRSSSRSTASNA